MTKKQGAFLQLADDVSVGEPKVYTNGAFVSPAKMLIDGREIWVWVVDEFSDDSFLNGHYCEPVETARCRANLLSDNLKKAQGIHLMLRERN